MEASKTRIDQLLALTMVNLKVRYRKTWVGFLWVLLNPVILLTVQSLVFVNLLHIPRYNYVLYLISGFLPWIFLSQSLEMGSGILKAQAQSLKAFAIPPFIVVSALITENIINFLVSIILIYFPLALIFQYPISAGFQWLVSLLPLAVGTSALVFLVATWNVFFRDLKFIVSFVLSISYFLTPIFYPLSALPEHIRWYAFMNPIAILLRPFQDAALNTTTAEWGQNLVLAWVVALVLVAVSSLSWLKQRNKFYLYL